MDTAPLIEQFVEFGRSKGIDGIPPDLKVNGITRFRVNGGKKKNGFAFLTLNPDGTAGGTIGDWADRSRDVKWHSGKNGSSLNGYDWKEHEAMFEKTREEERRIRAEKQEKTAVELRAEYEKGMGALPSFPYLQKKQIKPHGIKQRHNALLIPMNDRVGKLMSIQRIFADEKNFSPRAVKSMAVATSSEIYSQMEGFMLARVLPPWRRFTNKQVFRVRSASPPEI